MRAAGGPMVCVLSRTIRRCCRYRNRGVTAMRVLTRRKGSHMGCFCHSFPPVGLLASLNLSASVALPGADIPLSLSAWLNLRGLPALPWEPRPNWLGLPLPSLQLNLRAVATISALAQLRAQVLAQFGL